MSRLIEISLYRKPLPLGSEFEGPLSRAIVDNVREALLVVDKNLRVVAASRSFYQTFRVNSLETRGRHLHELGDGQWNITALRTLLEQIVPEHRVLEDYEVEHEFPSLGHRIMLVNATRLKTDDSTDTMVLLVIDDVTERRAHENHVLHLLQQKELLVEQMEHRIANVLLTIASMTARALEQSQDSKKRSAWQECAANQIAGLTPRQRQVMDLVLEGQPSKNIAADLGISQRTVENHRARIMERTGTKSLPALTRLAAAAETNAGKS